MDYIFTTLGNLVHQTAFFNLTVGNFIMIFVACFFLYLAIGRGYEPLLLVPIAFGMLLVNLYPDIMKTVEEAAADGSTSAGLLHYFFLGDEWGIWPSLIFLGVGAMTDFGPLIPYGYGLFTGGLGAHYGAEEMGATVVPMSTGNTKKLVTMMVDFGVTGIMCTPSYLLHIAETIEEMGVRDQIKLKASINGAEPWTDGMRAQIEHQLGIHAHDIYGLSEIMGPGVATDCQFHRGLHIHEDHFLPEIVDQKTLKPLRDGMEGELVISTLTKEGLPLIRYRTKDLTSINHEICECGRTTARIARFTGRTDDMLIIRGVNVFPSQIESALLEMGGTTPHYLLIVDRINNLDTLEVQVEVEERFFSDEIRELENLTGKIAHVIQEAIGLAVKVKLVEPKSIERSMGKTKHVIDKRTLI